MTLGRSHCSSTDFNTLFCSVTSLVCFLSSDRGHEGHQNSTWTLCVSQVATGKVVLLNASSLTHHCFTITYMISIHFFFSRSTRNHNFILLHVSKFIKILSAKSKVRSIFSSPQLCIYSTSINKHMQLSETLACWGCRERLDRKEVSQATPQLQILEETAVKSWQQQVGKMGCIRKGLHNKPYTCTLHLYAPPVWRWLKMDF